MDFKVQLLQGVDAGGDFPHVTWVSRPQQVPWLSSQFVMKNWVTPLYTVDVTMCVYIYIHIDLTVCNYT